MTDVTLDGVALSSAVPEAIVKRVRRQLLGDPRDVYELVPGRAGSWLFGEQPGDRIITVELALVGDNAVYPLEGTALEARRVACRSLAAWAESPRSVELVVDDESDRYWLSKLSSTPTPDEWLARALIDLDFRSSPYAYAVTLSTQAESLTDGIPASFSTPDEVNAYPVIELVAGASMPSGFTLTVNGLVLTYGTAVAIGDVLTISSLTYTVSAGPNTDTDLDGVFVAADLAMADVDGDFPILIPGSNTITVAGGASTVTITWRRRYQ